MRIVTYEEFLKFPPCWLETEEGRSLREYKSWWGDGKTALDILKTDKIDKKDIFFTILKPEFIDEPILHEFACRCAERVISRTNNPEPEIIIAIKAKRAWIKGKITDKELLKKKKKAELAVQKASEYEVAIVWDAVKYVMLKSAWESAFYTAVYAAWDAIDYHLDWRKERQWQMDELRQMLI